MCGIAGVVSLKQTISPDSISEMVKSIRHRGPDDEGFLAFNSNEKKVFSLISERSQVAGRNIYEFQCAVNAFLGHVRLSILDISPKGHQPFTDNDESVWLVFNGEIYNYIEIRQELISEGIAFCTQSDTEVVLKSYLKWGTHCVNRFNGMWSFVLYDKNRNILFGSRDRFGVKPFYYVKNSEYFCFASEIKAIVSSGLFDKKIESSSAFRYFVFGSTESGEKTFFKDILELQPSHSFILSLEDGTFNVFRYYHLDYSPQWETINTERYNEIVANVREKVTKAIRLRLRADVNIGTCLSGGIDSSSIVGIISELMNKQTFEQLGLKQKVFTASYKNFHLDETHWAKMVVEKTGADWHQTYPQGNELFEDLEDLVYLQDIPFGSTSIYAQYRVMKLASENGVKVMLDGQGGDELFAGYSYFYQFFFYEMFRKKKPGRFVTEINKLNNSAISKGQIYKFIFNELGRRTMPDLLHQNFYKRTKPEFKYLNKDFIEDNMDTLLNIKSKNIDTLNHRLAENFVDLGLKSLLRYEDRNSMRFAIESRTPLADDIDLIDYMFSVPGSYKIVNGWSKSLFRDSMKGVLPDPIRLRTDKIGFATPESTWLFPYKRELKQYFTSNLREYLNLEAIDKDWDVLFSPSSSVKVWRLLNFAIWNNLYKPL
jgi:asparagine synthase (glutamine-hydrolysing)